MDKDEIVALIFSGSKGLLQISHLPPADGSVCNLRLGQLASQTSRHGVLLRCSDPDGRTVTQDEDTMRRTGNRLLVWSRDLHQCIGDADTVEGEQYGVDTINEKNRRKC